MTTRTLSARFSSPLRQWISRTTFRRLASSSWATSRIIVGHPQGHQVGRQQRLAQVEDQVRVADLEQVQDALDVLFVDHADVGDFQRVPQDRQAGRLVLGQRPAQEVHVQPLDVPRQVGDRDVLEPVTSRAMSASPRARSRSIRATALCRVGGQGRGQVDRQRRAADAAARAEDGDRSTTRRSGRRRHARRRSRRCRRARPSARRRAASMSSSATGCVRKYFAPFWSDCSSAWWSWLMVRIGSFGCSTESWPIICRALLLVASRATMARSGIDVLDDVEEVLVAGALRFEPDEVDAQQQGAEGLAGRFGRVYDRDALHGHHRVSCPSRASARLASRLRGRSGAGADLTCLSSPATWVARPAHRRIGRRRRVGDTVSSPGTWGTAVSGGQRTAASRRSRRRRGRGRPGAPRGPAPGPRPTGHAGARSRPPAAPPARRAARPGAHAADTREDRRRRVALARRVVAPAVPHLPLPTRGLKDVFQE